MELCDFNLEKFNESNWKRIRATCPLPAGCLALDIWNIMKQIADGLTFVHSQGEVHRDLKPRNGSFRNKTCTNRLVLYSTRDKVWKLADFGLTSQGESHIALTTASGKGTPGYRAPELLLEEKPVYSRKVDIWGMGVIFYELANGKKPFASDTSVFVHYQQHQSLEASLNEGFDEYSQTAASKNISDMLQHKPESRPTATALLQSFLQSYEFTMSSGASTLETLNVSGKMYLALRPIPLPETKRRLKTHMANEETSVTEESSSEDPSQGSSTSSFDCDHPEILQRKHELAVEYHSRGQHEKAEKVYQDIVMRKQKSLGPDHSDTLSSKASQARLLFTYGTLRQHEEGIQMSVEVLNNRRETLGPDALDTLSSQDDVAMIYTKLGRLQDAVKLYQDTVDRRWRILGPHHPDTLSSQHNLRTVLAILKTNTSESNMSQR
jgi:serine/threonine protein kinase